MADEANDSSRDLLDMAPVFALDAVTAEERREIAARLAEADPEVSERFDTEVREVHDRVLVGSFSRRRLREFRRITGGRVPTSAAPLEVVAFRLLPSGRLADLLTRGEVRVLQVPHRRGRLTVVTPGLVRRAHAAGKHVHVWTVDDPDEMRTLMARLRQMIASDPMFDDTFFELMRLVMHHVADEEAVLLPRYRP